ncbi:MAG: hypothetical protein M3Z35_13520 [Nitrospirota bacterium]|nr:hypothetical protein [Nitrospirota bacterium]
MLKNVNFTRPPQAGRDPPLPEQQGRKELGHRGVQGEYVEVSKRLRTQFGRGRVLARLGVGWV